MTHLQPCLALACTSFLPHFCSPPPSYMSQMPLQTCSPSTKSHTRGPLWRRRPPKRTTLRRTRRINTPQLLSKLSQSLVRLHLVFISLSPSVSPSTSPMNLRRKNLSAHPGTPDMTPLQLTLAGLPDTRPAPKKKLTKDQQIAALKKELQVTKELLISSVSNYIYSILCL